MHYSSETQELEYRPTLPAGEPTDEVLMARIQAQDDQAIAILYRRHTALLRTVVGRILNNDCDVDDQLQDVFVEVWRQAAHYDVAKGKALGWIVTLARRRAIDKLRKKQVYARAQERLREEPEPTPHQGADEEVAESDTANIFRRVIATLPVPQREALDFSFYRGMSQREIAAHTGIPLGTIKTRLELALRKVRTAIVALGGMGEWSYARA
ncbi:MAG: sigma-70 family RNA polymerase sigma factor [Chthoniobacteraceae bacterium]